MNPKDYPELARLSLVWDYPQKLLVVAVFLALEAPLAMISYHASRRPRALVLPLSLLLFATVVPSSGWAALLLFLSLMSMFGVAIRARVRKTIAEEQRELAERGPSPWLGQSRSASLGLMGFGLLGMLIGIGADGNGPTSSPLAILLYFGGSIMLGMGLFRRHTVLVQFLGRSRARWLEVVQISTALVAYSLATFAEFWHDPGERLVLHALCFLPFALHFVLVWNPLMKAQERPALPETPFA